MQKLACVPSNNQRRNQKWANLRIDSMVDQWKHVWMTQPRERVDLMTKTRLMRGVGTDRRTEELDCEWRTVPILGGKNAADASFAKGAPDSISTYRRRLHAPEYRSTPMLGTEQLQQDRRPRCRSA